MPCAGSCASAGCYPLRAFSNHRLDERQVVLGAISEVFGPVTSPLYSILLESEERVRQLGLRRGVLVLAADGVGTTVQQQHLAHVESHPGGMDATQCDWVAQTDNDGSDNNLTDPWLRVGGAVSIAVGLLLGITLFFVHRRGDIDMWGPSIAIGLLLGSTLFFTAYV